jgi:hypothetical protein
LKTLTFNGDTYQADRIVNTDRNIIGYRNDGTEQFSFHGISDFSQFSLADGQVFDTDQSEPERLEMLEAAVNDLILGGGLV